VADPPAAVTLVADPPAHVRLEHRGRERLELGFGALVTTIRWTDHGAETGYAGARLREGTVMAGSGWSRVIELDPPAAAPDGEPVATASFSVRDAGVWVPVTLEVRPPA